MSRNLLAVLAGLVFGLGLCLSGMDDPNKVLAFLDLGGAWDPSLAFVMAGAIGVAAPAFALARRRRVALNGDAIQLPTRREIDAPLVLGALTFGVGWGLGGLCPGPAIVDIGFLSVGAIVFVAAMGVGALAHHALGLRLRSPRAAAQDA